MMLLEHPFFGAEEEKVRQLLPPFNIKMNMIICIIGGQNLATLVSSLWRWWGKKKAAERRKALVGYSM